MQFIVDVLDNSYLRLKKLAEAGFKSSLLLIGAGLVLLLIVFKINLISAQQLSPFLIIYTLVITTFELSRLGAAILFKKVDRQKVLFK